VQQTTTPTDTLLDFVARNGADTYSRDTPWKLLGGWFGAAQWAQAQHFYLDSVAALVGAGGVRRHARDIQRQLALKANAALAAVDHTLVERVARLSNPEEHGNADVRIHTLYHTSGARAEGTRRELMAATGLSVQRVKDLIAGRRRFSKGWAKTEVEAKRGRLPAGRKPRAIPSAADFFDNSGAPLF
jgi:hypothetical protein